MLPQKRKHFICQKRDCKKGMIPNPIRADKTVAKQSAEIAALRRELSRMKEKGKEDDIAAEVDALLNTPKNNKALNNETMSVTRQVMAMVARKKKDE